MVLSLNDSMNTLFCYRLVSSTPFLRPSAALFSIRLQGAGVTCGPRVGPALGGPASARKPKLPTYGCGAEKSELLSRAIPRPPKSCSQGPMQKRQSSHPGIERRCINAWRTPASFDSALPQGRPARRNLSIWREDAFRSTEIAKKIA